MGKYIFCTLFGIQVKKQESTIIADSKVLVLTTVELRELIMWYKQNGNGPLTISVFMRFMTSTT